jgi:hypothetical protein
VVLALLIGAAGASAATAPLTIAVNTHAEHPSVAVAADGSAVVSWADKSAPGGNLVRWCVIPAGTLSCRGQGALVPAGEPAGGVFVNQTQALYEGSTIVILADLQEGTKTEYEDVQEWQSTDGGLTFNTVNGGKAVASGTPEANTQMLNAVTLPGNTSVGVGFDTASRAPSFHATPLSAPNTCGRETFPATNCPEGVASLAPGSDADQVGNAPGNFTSDGASVMGVFRTNYSSGNLGCPGSSPFGMAWVFGTGLQSPSNDYNKSPGVANSAWRSNVTLADCGVDYIAAGSGPAGFGVLEDNQLTRQTQYHRFDSATQKFDTAPVIVSTSGEQQPSVSQDGAGGVYATYLSGGIGGPVSLSYSYNDGQTWSGPGTLTTDPLGQIAGLTSQVNPIGQGWATWTENGTVFAQPFTAADSVPPAAPTTLSTSQTGGGKTGASITIPAGTTGETDQATIAGANAATGTGTVTYTLYDSSSCTFDSNVTFNTVAVNAGAAAPSPPVTTALAPGTYYWRAVYSGNAANVQGAVGNLPSSSACGSEVLTVSDPVTISAKASTDGRKLTFAAACAKVPCTLQVAATAAAGGGKADVARASKGKGKPKSITLGKGKFKLKKKGTQNLTLKLSAKGRSFFAGKRKAKATIAVTEKIAGHDVTTTRAVTVKVKAAHRR